MKANPTSTEGGTGLRPVVSGVAPETGGATGHVNWVVLENVRHIFAEKIRRDAGFNRLEADATPTSA
jgi:hypothetical protein